MKKLSTYLFLILFSFQASSLADDIRDFQIEGMSVGGSALDYFSEREIKEAGGTGYIYSDKKFYSATFYYEPSFKIYHEVQFHLKNNDRKYKIYSIAGHIVYEDKIEECYEEMDKVVSEVKSLFNSATIDNAGIKKMTADKSGKSTVKSIYIDLVSGEYVSVQCFDWSKEKRLTDTLTVVLELKEFSTWLRNKAYK